MTWTPTYDFADGLSDLHDPARGPTHANRSDTTLDELRDANGPARSRTTKWWASNRKCDGIPSPSHDSLLRIAAPHMSWLTIGRKGTRRSPFHALLKLAWPWSHSTPKLRLTRPGDQTLMPGDAGPALSTAYRLGVALVENSISPYKTPLNGSRFVSLPLYVVASTLF